VSGLKPFRRPWLWLGAWGAAVLAVVVLSLIPPPPVPLPRHGDKLEHLLAYAALAAGAVQLFAGRARLLAIGLALAALGVALEFAQGAFTATRMADPADALANALGVAAGLATALGRGRDLLLRFEPGRHPAPRP